jgi:hypothetical protein
LAREEPGLSEREVHKFSNGVEVSVEGNMVKVFTSEDHELTHPGLSKKYIHAAVFLELKKRK